MPSGGCATSSSLKRPILAAIQAERPNSFTAMSDLLNLPNSQKVTKWSHSEALIKIWLIICEIYSLVDGSFVGRFTRSHDLDTYIGVMTEIEEHAGDELGRKISTMQSIKSLPFAVGEKERKYLSPGLPVTRAEFSICVLC